MDSDELQLSNIVGKKECFRVPDGYFEQLPDKIMAKLPKEEKMQGVGHLSLTFKQRKFIAAAIVVGAIGISIFMSLDRILQSSPQSSGAKTSAMVTSASVESHSDKMIDEFADYAMLDNEDMYSYLEDQ
jgi:hypothetical protein